MLAVATFAVASMVSAYSAAGSSATPRSFSLVVSDDVSQNALSSFIGAFIFSIVALIAFKNGYYNKSARFVLFALTLLVFTIVVLTFFRWTDRIARLGRLGSTVDKAETATANALQKLRCAPTVGGSVVVKRQYKGKAIYGSKIGYVQHINISFLQEYAEKSKTRIIIEALPGVFSAPDQVLAYVTEDTITSAHIETNQVAKAFLIGDGRTFSNDPRFGLTVLSEITSRALSPAVNDPGTAIDILGTFVRLFADWVEPIREEEKLDIKYDRVEIPEISIQDMLDDAFSAIARDDAGTVEVMTRLQKALASLASLESAALQSAAKQHACIALARAERNLTFPADLGKVRELAQFAI